MPSRGMDSGARGGLRRADSNPWKDGRGLGFVPIYYWNSWPLVVVGPSKHSVLNPSRQPINHTIWMLIYGNIIVAFIAIAA